jgi:hypothetical protein
VKLLKPGVVIKPDIEKKGDFTNLISWEVIGEAPPQPLQSISTGITGRESSIESQTSFKGFMEVAAAYITAGKELPEKTFVGQCLKAAFKWGAERLGATAEVIVESVKETPKQKPLA